MYCNLRCVVINEYDTLNHFGWHIGMALERKHIQWEPTVKKRDRGTEID